MVIVAIIPKKNKKFKIDRVLQLLELKFVVSFFFLCVCVGGLGGGRMG